MSPRLSRKKTGDPNQGDLFKHWAKSEVSPTPPPSRAAVESVEELTGPRAAKDPMEISPPQSDSSLEFPLHPISQAYHQAEYVDPNELRLALAEKPLGSFLHVRFPARYITETIEPIATRLRGLQSQISMAQTKGERSSYHSESEQWHHMERLLEVLGPYEFISYVNEHTRGANAGSKPFYHRRIFRQMNEATQHQSPLKKDGIRSVIPHALRLLGLPNDTRNHNSALARLQELSKIGILDKTPHPKEALTADLLSNAPQLLTGGRVLLVCNNVDQMEYLKVLLERHPRVSHVTDFGEVLSSNEHSENVSSPDHAYSSPSKQVEVVTATSHQLAQWKIQNPTAQIHAALFLAYDTGATQFTRREDRSLRTTIPAGIPGIFRFKPRTSHTFPKGAYPPIVTSKALVLDTTGSKREINTMFPLKRAHPTQSRLFS